MSNSFIADIENATLLDSLTTIERNSSEFEIPSISQKDVAETLLSTPSHKVTGNDGISGKLLKIAAPCIIPSLAKLLNHCLHAKTFPNVWKVAKVTPVFKGNGSKDDKNNYRPISVLPDLSKILKKHICNNLCKFLRENYLLHGYQSDFRKSFSTETSSIRLIEQLLFDFDGNRVTGLVFLDYKQAFDLINHELLIAKRQVIGVSEDYLPLFIDYMSDRKQYVNIDGYHSSTRSINLGVPQGSILGPVLLLVFIHDLPASLRNTIADIYADNTTISYATNYVEGCATRSQCWFPVGLGYDKGMVR